MAATAPLPTGRTTTTPAVRGTPAARRALRALVAAHGPLVVVQAEGCCDGGAPMVFGAEEFPLAGSDVRIGDVEGTPFYVAGRELSAWAHGDAELDVEPGEPDGFSLPAGPGLHFVARWDACPAPASHR